MKKIFFNARLVDKDTDNHGALFVNNGNIEKIFFDTNNADLKQLQQDETIERIDVQGNVLMPSFIDLHTHLRNPGQSQKETIESYLNAAVAGGFGTVVAMPNTNPIISSMELANLIQDECASYNKCDVIQAISLTKDFAGTDTSHLDTLEGFPITSEDGRDVANSNTMLEAMKKCAKKNIVVSCHCEEETHSIHAKPLRAKAIELLKDHSPNNWGKLTKETTSIDLDTIDQYFSEANEFLRTAEDDATERNIELAQQANCHVHIDHASTVKTMELIKAGKKSMGENLTCEVTPHHIALSSDNQGFFRYIVNPPIRTNKDRLALIEGIKDGTVDCIATDHAPHTVADKQSGSPGFSGLETSFAVSYTELVATGLINVSKLSALMSANPAKIIGKNTLGLLKEGYRANLVIIDENTEWEIDSSTFKTKGAVCPFEGKLVKGRVLRTFYNGCEK